MMLGNVKNGEWFTNRSGKLFIRVEPFLCGNSYYQAINLLTGELAFATRMSTAGAHVLSDDTDVTIIEKPSMVTSFTK